MRRFLIICIVIALLVACVLTGIWQAVAPGSQRIESSDVTDVLFYNATYDEGLGGGFRESVFVQCEGMKIRDRFKVPRSIEDTHRFGIVLSRDRFSDDPDPQTYRYPVIDFSSPWDVCHSVPIDGTNAFLHGGELWNHLSAYDKESYAVEAHWRSEHILAKWANRDFFTREEDRAFLKENGFTLVPARRLPQIAKP